MDGKEAGFEVCLLNQMDKCLEEPESGGDYFRNSLTLCGFILIQ